MRSMIQTASNRIFTEGREFISEIPVEQMFTATPPLANHAAWQVGHIAVTLNFGLKVLGQELVVEKSWGVMYGNGSTPSNDPTNQPSAAQLIGTMNLVQKKLVDSFLHADESVLQAENTIERLRERYPHNGDFVVFLLTAHAGMHFGQIATLRKLLKHSH